MVSRFERASGPILIFIIFLLLIGVIVFSALYYTGVYSAEPVSVDSITCNLSGTNVYLTAASSIGINGVFIGPKNYSTNLVNVTGLSNGKNLLEFFSPHTACIQGSVPSDYSIFINYSTVLRKVYSTGYAQNPFGYIESRTLI